MRAAADLEETFGWKFIVSFKGVGVGEGGAQHFQPEGRVIVRCEVRLQLFEHGAGFFVHFVNGPQLARLLPDRLCEIDARVDVERR